MLLNHLKCRLSWCWRRTWERLKLSPAETPLPFVFQAEGGIRDNCVTGVKTCALLISSRRRHTRSLCDWSSDVCSSDLSPIQLRPYLLWAIVGITNANTAAMDVTNLIITLQYEAFLYSIFISDRKSVV